MLTNNRSIKEEIAHYGKPMIARKMGVYVSRVIDVAFQDEHHLSPDMIALLSLPKKTRYAIFDYEMAEPPKEFNAFKDLMEQSSYMDMLVSRCQHLECDIVIEISVALRTCEGCDDESHITKNGIRETYWFAGKDYDNALEKALSFVADYHEVTRSSVQKANRGESFRVHELKKLELEYVKSFFNRILPSF